MTKLQEQKVPVLKGVGRCGRRGRVDADREKKKGAEVGGQG